MEAIVLPIVVLNNGVHRNKHQVFMRFRYDEALISCARRIGRWSTSLKCWYVPYRDGCIEAISACFEGVAIIDSSKMVDIGLLGELKGKKQGRVLNDEQRAILNTFYRYLQGKRYSVSTVNTYVYLVADFVEFCGGKSLEALTNRDVELFIEAELKRKCYSVSTQRQFISGMKLFVMLYPEVCINELKLERPKASRLLPQVLSTEEVIRLLVCAKNLKHRAILAMIYSSGLRISELLNLELCDINEDRKQVRIKNSKGRKDRYVVLADGIMRIMNDYKMAYVPKRWFVEGRGGGQYTAGSVRKFLKGYCRSAGIDREVTPHTLRHSYATHLLEQGINLRHIQELLGHSKPETTMIYTHVARKDLIAIKSPLDIALKGMTRPDDGVQKVIISG